MYTCASSHQVERQSPVLSKLSANTLNKFIDRLKQTKVYSILSYCDIVLDSKLFMNIDRFYLGDTHFIMI